MTRRILLADDDADDRMLFEEVLAGLPDGNFSFASVDNGEEVIMMLNNIHHDDDLPDLIVLDQNMPLRSGKETLIYLKQSERFKNIPVILYSTYNEAGFVKECQALGALSVTSKPDSYEGFITMINSFLAYSHL